MNINSNLLLQNYDRVLINQDLGTFKKKAEDPGNPSKNNSSSITDIVEEASDLVNDEKIKFLANEFTSILIKQMFKSMRNTVPEGELLNGGFAEEVFTDMLDDEYSKNGAEQNSFNSLGRILYQQLTNR